MWSDNKPVVNGWLAIPSFFSAELMSNQNWDSLTVDMQHGLVGYDNLLPMLAAIKKPMPALARVPWLEPGIIMKALDAGCVGIICPMVNNGDDAEKLVQALRYPPRGGRSFGPTRALLAHGADYASVANENIIAFAMVETKQALENVDDIMSVDGIDAVYIGPADLSNSLGHTPKLDQEEPEVVEAIDMVLAKAKEHGVRAGIHNGSAGYATRMIDKGFNFVTIMSDARLLVKATEEELGKMAGKQHKGSEGVY